MPRLRTFIAVDLNKAIRDRVVALQHMLARSGSEVKWTEPENLHVTLLFLGEVDSREVPKVCQLVAEGAARQPEFLMQVEGVGCFPTPRRPRIVWIGVGEGAPALCALHDALEAPLENLGYRREERHFTPHITLGRAKSDRDPGPLVEALTKHAAWNAGKMAVKEVVVMSSQLKSQGPAYTVLTRALLG